MLILNNNLKKISSKFPYGSVRWNSIFLNNFITQCSKKHGFDINNKIKPTVLDIGCGFQSLISYNNHITKIGFDGWKPSLELAKKSKTHDEFIHGTFANLDKIFKRRKFDFIIAIDFIEHLEKDDGFNFLNWIEEHANCGVAIYTPNGFLYQPHIQDGDFQKHLSGWNIDDFKSKGYTCNGGAGLKILRKEFHQIKFKPKIFWSAISYLSQSLFTSSYPKFAAALWATKTL